MSLFERQYDERISGLSFRDLSDDVASDAQSSPDIILDTLSLALSAIDNKMNLVVSTPSRERFGRVLAALLAIDAQLKEDETARFTKATTPDSDFAIGDKLKMGNAIVEYAGVSTAIQGTRIDFSVPGLRRELTTKTLTSGYHGPRGFCS